MTTLAPSFTVPEVARNLRVGEDSVRSAIERGELGAIADDVEAVEGGKRLATGRR